MTSKYKKTSVLGEDLKPLCDSVAERLVISCLVDHGEKVLFEIDGVCGAEDFYNPENRHIYDVVKKLVIDHKTVKPSLTEIVSHVDADLKTKYDIPDYLSAILVDKVPPENIKKYCLSIKRFAIARKLRTGMLDSIVNLGNISGEERVMEIIGMAEKPIINISNAVFSQQSDVEDLSGQLENYLSNIVNNPNPHRGIPSGFPIWDAAIGGGLRGPGVHLVCARAKVGKSYMALNIANNVTALNVPVLYLDTELTKEMILGRWLALLSGVPTDMIETGEFLKNPANLSKIREVTAEAATNHKNFHYINISGKDHTEWLSIIRRWITTKVGFDKDGKTKDCLIILDYIKTTDTSQLSETVKEFQYLGQIITDLHNICVAYNVPMLSFGQLNRDGINNDDQGAVGGSDRLVALCSSLTYIRIKNEEDFADDPKPNGDRKLIVVCSRFGRGLQNGEYVNLITNLGLSKMSEGNTNLENRDHAITLSDEEKMKL